MQVVSVMASHVLTGSNKLDFKPNGSYARLFDYNLEAADYKEALEKLTEAGVTKMDYLKSSQPTSSLYQTLQRELERTTDKEARHRLAVNMERCRWRVKQPEETGRRVLVNIPALQLWAVGGDTVLNMRIVCGAKATKTPLLHSQIKYMQVNPEWLIPKNIIDNEVAHHGAILRILPSAVIILLIAVLATRLILPMWTLVCCAQVVCA